MSNVPFCQRHDNHGINNQHLPCTCTETPSKYRDLLQHLDFIAWKPDKNGDPNCDQGAVMAAEAIRTLERQLTAANAQLEAIKSVVCHSISVTCIHHTDAERGVSRCPVCIGSELMHARSTINKLNAQLEEWKQHAALSDKEFLQMSDWLIGNALWDKNGLINHAEKLKERIRDLIAAETQLEEARKVVVSAQKFKSLYQKNSTDPNDFVRDGDAINEAMAELIRITPLAAMQKETR